MGPLSASRSIQSNWTMKPVNDDNRLMAMRYLYLWILNYQNLNLYEADRLLAKYFPLDKKCNPTLTLGMVCKGWFRSGSWHEKPKEARVYTHKHLTAYWVEPGHEEDFTKFTLTMLRIATYAPRTQTVVRYHYDDVHSGRLDKKTTTTEAVECVAQSGGTPRSKVNLALREGFERAVQAKHLEAWSKMDAESTADKASIKSNIDALADAMTDALLQRSADIAANPQQTVNEVFDTLSSPQTVTVDPISKTRKMLWNRNISVSQDTLRNSLPSILPAIQNYVLQQGEYNSSPDPDLRIDNFSNPEISPGLITLPH